MDCPQITYFHNPLKPSSLEAVGNNFVKAKRKQATLAKCLQNKFSNQTALFNQLIETAKLCRDFHREYVQLTYSKEELLVRTYNCFTRRFFSIVLKDIEVEISHYSDLLKKEYITNTVLLERLEQMPKLEVGDLFLGCCVPITTFFLRELAGKADLTEEDVIKSAEKLQNGLEDIKAFAFQLIRDRLAEKERSPLLKYKKGKPSDKFAVNRKYHNFFAKLSGEKLKKVHIVQNDGIAIPADLKAGLYAISICSTDSKKYFWESKGMKIQHRLAFVKLNENQSYIFDCNAGLIRCLGFEQTIKQLKKLQKFYSDIKINGHFHTSLSRFTLL